MNTFREATWIDSTVYAEVQTKMVTEIATFESLSTNISRARTLFMEGFDSLPDSILAESVEKAKQQEKELEDKNRGFLERNKLVAVLAALFPASLERLGEDKRTKGFEWSILLDTPAGQISFILHNKHLCMFKHVPREAGMVYDGAKTKEKYKRIEELITILGNS